jgi:putative ABC transport system permease protein
MAVLKAIGFSDFSILCFVLAEALIIAVFGGLLGLGLAILAVPALGNALNGLLPALVLSPAILSGGLAIAVLIGVAGGILPGIGAMRMRVVNALRRV